jgi:hypothetical protein
LPSTLAQEIGGIVGSISDPIKVMGIAGTCVDRRISFSPLTTFGSDPSRAGIVVLSPRLGLIRYDMLVVGPKKRKM